jgi:O-antigen/teichoic acid export membrane protein
LSQKREASYTIAANLAQQAVTAVCGFILPPLVIKTFGSGVNGMVTSIGQFIAYLSIVEAGIGGASIAALYKPLVEGDAAKRDGILSAARVFYNRSGFLFTGLSAALAALYPLAVKGQVDAGQARLLVLMLGISGTAEYFLIGKYRVLLTADHKTYVLTLIQIAGTIVNTVISVYLLKFTAVSIVTVKVIPAAVYLSRYIFIRLYVWKKYPALNLREKPDTASLEQRWDVMVHQIGALVVFNSPVIVLTLFCDLKDVSVYMVYGLVFNALNSLMGSFSTGLQAFFGKLMVDGGTKRIAAICRRYETIYFIVLGWVYSCAYVLTIPFIQIYTRNMTDAEYIRPNLAFLFVVVGAANKLRIPAGLLIDASGHFRQTKYRSLLESGINVAASIFFTLRYGFTGVLLGSICSYTYRTADIIIYSGRRFTPGTLPRTFGKIAALTTYYAGGAALLQTRLPYSGNSYREWLIYAAIFGTLLAVPAATYLVVSNRKELMRLTAHRI